MLKLKKKSILLMTLICLDCIFVFLVLINEKEKDSVNKATSLNSITGLALNENFSDVNSEVNYVMDSTAITQEDVVSSQEVIINEQQEKFQYRTLITKTELDLSISVKKYVDESKAKAKKIIPPKVTGDVKSVKGVDIANFSLQFDGNPYVLGGTSLTNGADCSGFVQSLYKSFGINIPRGATSQSLVGTEVSIKDVKEGDLVFYSNGGDSVEHVAMYIGNGKIIHAQTPKDGIGIDNINVMKRITIKRILEN